MFSGGRQVRATEPCNPFPNQIPDQYESHRPYAEALGYAARKAGVVRPVTIMQGDKLPMNLEVLPRADAKGTLMVVVINHDATAASYQVALDPSVLAKLKQAQVWDMLQDKVIEAKTDGQFDLAVPAWGVSLFMVGSEANLAPIKKVQAQLRAKDLSVPQYFRDRPTLNEGQWGTDVPEIGQ